MHLGTPGGHLSLIGLCVTKRFLKEVTTIQVSSRQVKKPKWGEYAQVSFGQGLGEAYATAGGKSRMEYD